MYDEFRVNYIPHAPIIKNERFQLLSMNLETKYVESPAPGSWKKFMEYKNFC
jgi:hypothetical protein